MSIERFEDLTSWQEARKLMQTVCHLTHKTSFRRSRWLEWQLRSAAGSCMGNIAEAHGRYSFEDKRRFFDISLGSCKELQSHLDIALDRGYVSQIEFQEAYQQAEVAARLINGALDNLDRQIAKRSPERPGPRRKSR